MYQTMLDSMMRSHCCLSRHTTPSVYDGLPYSLFSSCPCRSIILQKRSQVFPLNQHRRSPSRKDQTIYSILICCEWATNIVLEWKLRQQRHIGEDKF